MNTGKPVFSQLMDWIHPEQFRRCVERYRGEYKVQSFSCWDQFLCMAFGQMTYRDSLRDTVACLIARPDQLYHMGFRGSIARSTLADANETRDWRIFADLAQRLIIKARRLYAGEDLGFDLNNTAYALDATTIDLCLSLYPWAYFRATKSGIKLHTLLDLRGPIPTLITLTPAQVHDVNILDDLIIEAGAFYIMDRGYLDFARLYRIHLARAFFVIRAKCNLQFMRYQSHPILDPRVRSDQTGRLDGFYARRDYPDILRRIHYFDPETEKYFVFLTNHLLLPALTIARLYKCRWTVELFFKWIKQHLRIKTFYGTSSNAVKTQIWIAICVYLLVAILKKELGLPQSLHNILQVLSVSTFEKVPIYQLLTEEARRTELPNTSNQLLLNI